MSVLALGFFAALRGLWLPALVAIGLGAALLRWLPPPAGAGAEIAQAQGLWLHVPAWLLTATGIAAAIELWPLLGRDRPGRVWLQHTRRPGRDAALALLAAIACLLPLLAALGATFGALAAHWHGIRAECWVRFVTADRLLAPGQARVTFRAADQAPVHRLVLRADVLLPRGADIVFPRVRLLADGEPLHDVPLEVRGPDEPLVLQLAPRPLREVTLARVPGPGLPVELPPDALRGAGGARSPVVNGALAAAACSTTAAPVLALVLVLRALVARALLHCLALTLQLAAALGGLTAAPAAIAAFARGSWLPAEALTPCVPCCLLAALAIGAVGLMPWRRSGS